MIKIGVNSTLTTKKEELDMKEFVITFLEYGFGVALLIIFFKYVLPRLVKIIPPQSTNEKTPGGR